MLDHVLEATTIVQGKTRADLLNDRVLNLALVRLLEVIGEAANQISREEQAKYSTIPWPQVIGLRNRLIHGYDTIDLEIIWQIVTNDLPSLAIELGRILSIGSADDQRER